MRLVEQFVERELKSDNTEFPTLELTLNARSYTLFLQQDNDLQFDRIHLNKKQAVELYNFLREVLY